MSKKNDNEKEFGLYDLIDTIINGIGIEFDCDEYCVKVKPSIGRSINLMNEIEKVTFNNPATVVFWKDGTKTVTKCCKGDTFNKELGLAMCIIRKLCNNRHYNDVFTKYCNSHE